MLSVKEHLNRHLLWSAKPVVIMQQVWAVLIIAQILQALRLEIAWRAGVDPFEVSIALLVEYAPPVCCRGPRPGGDLRGAGAIPAVHPALAQDENRGTIDSGGGNDAAPSGSRAYQTAALFPAQVPSPRLHQLNIVLVGTYGRWLAPTPR